MKKKTLFQHFYDHFGEFIRTLFSDDVITSSMLVFFGKLFFVIFYALVYWTALDKIGLTLQITWLILLPFALALFEIVLMAVTARTDPKEEPLPYFIAVMIVIGCIMIEHGYLERLITDISTKYDLDVNAGFFLTFQNQMYLLTAMSQFLAFVGIHILLRNKSKVSWRQAFLGDGAKAVGHDEVNELVEKANRTLQGKGFFSPTPWKDFTKNVRWAKKEFGTRWNDLTKTEDDKAKKTEA